MSQYMVAGLQHQAAIESTGPITQTSTSSVVDVVGAEIDARQWKFIAYTIIATVNGITYSLWGANAADYSDEVQIASAAVSVGTNASTYGNANFGYYRVKIIDTVGGTHGVATVNGLAK